MREREWAAQAACKNKPGEWWYQPDDLSKHEWERGDRAKGRIVCAKCPVRQACLDEAIREREPFGVWGGFDASERNTIANGSEARLLLGRCALEECGAEFAAPHFGSAKNNVQRYCSQACGWQGKKREQRDKAAKQKLWRAERRAREAALAAPPLFDAYTDLVARIEQVRDRKQGEAS